MKETEHQIEISPAEKQVLDHPATLKIFLFILVPVLAGFNIYLSFNGMVWGAALVSLELICFIAVLSVVRSEMPDEKRIRIYRYLFQAMIMMLGGYLVFIIGVVHRLMATPWAFLFVFFLSLWMPGRRGTVISAVFNLALILMIPLTDVEVFTTHREFLIRFHLALFLFSLMAHKSTTIRKNYLSNLFKARAETERSEQKYKALSDRLMKEIEHRDRIEKRLHHAIKMETVGRVAAGVAHDLNNILSGIVTYPDYMLLDLDEDDPIRESLETIKTSGMRAATIVDDLLTLSRRGVAVAEPLDLNRLLQSYLESPEHLQLMAAFDTVSLTVEYEEGNGGAVVGSPVHLAKTLMNLIANAVESIQGEGEVAISIRFEDLSKPEPIANPVQGHRIIPPGDYMVFSVSDTGIGIAPKDLESVFEPFYTRKQMGRSGTGLGMAVVLGTVNDHKGFIQMTSIPGKGTRISLYFPATSGASYGDASPVSEGIEALMGNNEKILVVDDEPVQLNIAEKLLTRLGYTVHCCPSGEACLEFTGKYPVDLVILDIIMEPGMDGVSACRKLLAARPDQKVLFVTGYSDTATLEKAGKLSGGPCLFKPYTLEDMGRMVRERLVTP